MSSDIPVSVRAPRAAYDHYQRERDRVDHCISTKMPSGDRDRVIKIIQSFFLAKERFNIIKINYILIKVLSLKIYCCLLIIIDHFVNIYNP